MIWKWAANRAIVTPHRNCKQLSVQYEQRCRVASHGICIGIHVMCKQRAFNVTLQKRWCDTHNRFGTQRMSWRVLSKLSKSEHTIFFNKHDFHLMEQIICVSICSECGKYFNFSNKRPVQYLHNIQINENWVSFYVTETKKLVNLVNRLRHSHTYGR